MRRSIVATLFQLLTLFLFLACNAKVKQEQQSPSKENEQDGEVWVEMLVEIPAGTTEKYEFNKDRKVMVLDSIDGKPRIIEYLGYPGNYGMIPNTLLPYDKGGDGDPLDIIALGPPAERGSTINCKVIGVLKLKDKGEQDDKLIGLSEESGLKNVDNLEDLDKLYPGITSILETWFLNYKGAGKMKSEGFYSKNEAVTILKTARQNKP